MSLFNEIAAKPAPRKVKAKKKAPPVAVFAKPIGRADAPILKAQKQAKKNTAAATRTAERGAVAPAIPKIDATPKQRAGARVLVAKSLREQGITTPAQVAALPKVQRERANRAIGYVKTQDKQTDRAAKRAGAAPPIQAGAGDVPMFKGSHITKQQWRSSETQQAATAAPVLKVLNTVARPVHAIAGGVDALVQGKGLSEAHHAAARGLEGKDHTLFSDVLKHAGAPKIVQSVGGLALDVGLDPTTYLTGGAGSLAEKAAVKEGQRVAAKALKAGMSPQGAETVARRAAKNAAAKNTTTRGVVVKFAGKEVPGVRAATAKTGDAVKKVTRTAPGRVHDVAAGARTTAREFRPQIAPVGVSQAEHQVGRQIARKARAAENRGMAQVEAESRALMKRIPVAQHAAVIDAVERDVIGMLPVELREPARWLRDNGRYLKRVRTRAGVAEGDIRKVKRRVVVPEVTADVKQSARDLAAAKRARATAGKKAAAAEYTAGRAAGRAEVRGAAADRRLRREIDQALRAAQIAEKASANYARRGMTAEAAAARGRVTDALARHKTLTDRLDTKPAGSLRVAERAGGNSVLARQQAKAAVVALRTATESHAATKVAAKEQRAARTVAVRRAKVAKESAREHFPHAREDILDAGHGAHSSLPRNVVIKTRAKAVARPGSGSTRADRRPLAAANVDLANTGRPLFSTNIPLVHANYAGETARGAAHAQLLRDIADQGRSVKQWFDKPQAGEQVYRLGHDAQKQYGLHPVSEKQIADVLAGKPGKAGRYVALKKDLVDTALAAGRSSSPKGSIGLLDSATRGFKRVAVATPGFHIRNLIGDTQMAFLEQPGHLMPRNVAQAAKGLKQVHRVENAASDLARPAATSATIKVAGKRMSVADFAAGAERNGVIRSGYIGRELTDLARRGEATGVRKVRKGIGSKVNRFLQDREDLMRLATYKHGLDRGLSEQAAADLSLSVHIDYGDLSEKEREVWRRVMPFYTFSARSVPIHAKALVKSPGKFATVEKVREEAAKATGVDLNDAEGSLSKYAQKNAPLIVKIGGKTIALGFSPPLSALNELPVGTDVGAYLGEVGQFLGGLVNPVLKDPVELAANHSFFTQGDIESADRPLVVAPSWAKYLPDALKKQAHYTEKYTDKRTGKKSAGWRGRADYFAKALPGPIALANSLLTDGSGRGTGGKLLSGLGGVKVDAVDAKAALTARINLLYDTSDAMDKRAAELRQQGTSADAPTPEYRKLLDDHKKVNEQIHALSVQRGDKVALKRTSAHPAKSGWGVGTSAPKSGWDVGSGSGQSAGWNVG